MGDIKQDAGKLLYDLGLLKELEKYGTPHVIGSYVMDTMACRDLDVDVTNENMSTEKLYRLTSFILGKYAPTWYEAKQETTDEGKTVWFHGFETLVLDELWNVDIWFLDNVAIQKAEEFCNNVKMELDRNIHKKEAVIQIKKDLIDQGLYSFDRYTSMDVYKAVLEDSIMSAEAFLQHLT